MHVILPNPSYSPVKEALLLGVASRKGTVVLFTPRAPHAPQEAPAPTPAPLWPPSSRTLGSGRWPSHLALSVPCLFRTPHRLSSLPFFT